MYITIHEIDHQSKFDAWNCALKGGALGQPRQIQWGGGGRRVQHGGTQVQLWLIHVDIWKKQQNIVK